MLDILITIIVIAALALAWIMLYDSNRFVVRTHTVTDRRIISELEAPHPGESCFCRTKCILSH